MTLIEARWSRTRPGRAAIGQSGPLTPLHSRSFLAAIRTRQAQEHAADSPFLRAPLSPSDLLLDSFVPRLLMIAAFPSPASSLAFPRKHNSQYAHNCCTSIQPAIVDQAIAH